MTIPIPYGYNFKVNHKKKDNHFSMASLSMYGNIYGIGYTISADRLIITPDKTIAVHPGNVQFMHKNLYHRTTCISDGVYENMDIKFNEAVAARVVSVIGKEAFQMLFEQVNFTLTPEAQTQIAAITAALEREWNKHDEYSNAIAENLIAAFFVTVLRGRTAAPTPDIQQKENHYALLNALSYIQRSYAQDPSLKQTADAVHISEAYLSRLFQSEFDTTYSRFLTEIKLSNAMQLLINTELSVTEIGHRCGYPNSNYFTTVFKKYIGIPPLQFRKNSKKT